MSEARPSGRASTATLILKKHAQVCISGIEIKKPNTLSPSFVTAKLNYIDFQARTQPLAYLITFRSYGTWLHGDERGSIDRRNYNRYGTPAMPANMKLLADERAELGSSPSRLNRAQRRVVELAIQECANISPISSTLSTLAQIMFIP